MGGDSRHGCLLSSWSRVPPALRRASRASPPRRGCRRAAPGTDAARCRTVADGIGELAASRSRGRCPAVRRVRRAESTICSRSASRSPWAAPRNLTARSRVRPSVTALPRPASGSAIQRASSARPASETVYTFLSGRPCWTTGVDVHPAVVLHRPQRPVDLLMRGAPEVADGAVEPAGELVARAGLLAQRHQDRVGECHVGSVCGTDGPMQLVACTNTRIAARRGASLYMQRLVSVTA